MILEDTDSSTWQEISVLKCNIILIEGIVGFTGALGNLENFEYPGHCVISSPKCTTDFLACIDWCSVHSFITDDV